MNVCKTAYKVVRENSNEIYRGFGFKHLSDGTQYYVHPNNESYEGRTTLCQPIGEGIGLLVATLDSIIRGESTTSDYFYSKDKNEAFINIAVPEDWRENSVVDSNIYYYLAFLRDNDTIAIGAYDEYFEPIEGNMEHIHPLYKMLPIIAVMLCGNMSRNDDFKNMVMDFVKNPEVDSFVNIHEDFYQNNKKYDYNILYMDLRSFDTSKMESFAEGYKIIRENNNDTKAVKNVRIKKFPKGSFDSQYSTFIPNLSKEFQLPTGLKTLCSAITEGDVRAVLFYGPAGTGKTMSCKLVAQSINMPILETINCTENLDEFVLGKFIPQEDKIVFKESYVTKAIRDGGAVVFEEINFARPQYLAFLNSILDDNGFVKLDNGEIVHRHKNFRFFATMNLGYFGTKELNQALYNRFNAIIEIGELSDSAISKMLSARVPECTDKIDKLLSVYHKIKGKIKREELDIVISPRNLENWARLAKYEGYIKAAEKTLIPIAKCDRALENSIRGILRIYKWK